MFRIAVIIVLLFAFAAGFAWLADNPGTVTVQWPWADARVEISLMQAAIVMAVVAVTTMVIWWIISGIINSPKTFGRWRSGRRRDKGYNALSKGLVAVGSGDAKLARKLVKESGKLLENEPLVALLDAQTAMLENDRPTVRKQFETMLGDNQTRLLGLRGLYLEAEQEGQMEAAAHFAKEAATHSPGTPWATQALLKVQTISGDWENALSTLETARNSNAIDKMEYARKKAVLLTALAMVEEDGSPEKAKAHALLAHKLAPGLVPASVLAARVCVRLNDTRKANKVLEATWKHVPHPEIADTYVGLSLGNSAAERLKRAEKLAQKQEDHREAQFILAKTAIDTGDYAKARSAMEIVLKEGPTENACLIMADIEEAEHGNRGRVREWLSRAVSAAKDPVWIADSVTSAEWAPCSPVTGKLDAFEWKAPVEQLDAASNALDYSRFVNEPLEDLTEENIIDVEDAKPTVVATVIGAAATADEVGKIEDAETIDVPEPGTENVPDANTDAQAPDLKLVKTDTIEEGNTDSPAEEPASAETATAEAIKNEEPATDDSEDSSKTEKEEVVPSPFKSANLDKDEDGVIDHRPDDPGIDNKEQPKKKGWLF